MSICMLRAGADLLACRSNGLLRDRGLHEVGINWIFPIVHHWKDGGSEIVRLVPSECQIIRSIQDS